MSEKFDIDQDKIKELDSHWNEVLKLAEQHGFIVQAHGGTAVLATHENQLATFGEKDYLDRMRIMYGLVLTSRGVQEK